MIEIKKSELAELSKKFDHIKLNKISDPVIRKMILKVVLEGKKLMDSVQADIASVREKFFSEFKQEDMNAFQIMVDEARDLYLRNKGSEFMEKTKEIVEKYPEINDAYNKYMLEIQNLQDEKVELNIDKVNTDAFIDAMSEQSVDITPKYLEEISPILSDDIED